MPETVCKSSSKTWKLYLVIKKGRKQPKALRLSLMPAGELRRQEPISFHLLVRFSQLTSQSSCSYRGLHWDCNSPKGWALRSWTDRLIWTVPKDNHNIMSQCVTWFDPKLCVFVTYNGSGILRSYFAGNFVDPYSFQNAVSTVLFIIVCETKWERAGQGSFFYSRGKQKLFWSFWKF